MEPFKWTVSLVSLPQRSVYPRGSTRLQMYGMPFFVTVSDANGVGWSNGPIHPTGDGSTSCLDLDAALHPKPPQISAGGAAGIAIGTLVLGALIGLLGSFLLARWKFKNGSPSHPFAYARKLSDPGDTPTLSQYPPSSAMSTTFGSSAQRGGHADEHGLLAGSPATPAFAHNQSFSLSEREDGVVSPTGHQHSPSAGSSNVSPTNTGAPPRSPLGGLGQNSASHVYVVHHDAGRPPPVTVFTSDGTEVVELPPQYETAARREEQEREQQGQGRGASGARPLPTSPPTPSGQRRVPRSLPQKPTMVASNADAPATSPSSPANSPS
ncbi:hypothetical protein TRAPUB_9429 [Trametes pubescens]|uniref:Uncharacterized protein n=1 Tax=Trametes pubescens TaxID=154538 RepID=A0A1M2W2D7_TRAPU|nr:hypothetical protein TRAPUB_9429 [Trametes pubescens]